MQPVDAEALQATFGAAGSSVKLVVLSACFTEIGAARLCAQVDCVVGIPRSIGHEAALPFAIGFYGGLGERASVAEAFAHGCAAIGLAGSRHADRAQLRTRAGVDAGTLVLG
jgi:hypothetical protein